MWFHDTRLYHLKGAELHKQVEQGNETKHRSRFDLGIGIHDIVNKPETMRQCIQRNRSPILTENELRGKTVHC